MGTVNEVRQVAYDEFVPSSRRAGTDLNVHQRLAAAMGEVSYIQKDDIKPGMKYRVVTHDKVTALVRPALLKHGIVYYPVDLKHTQEGNRTEVALTVRFVNIDNPADHFDVPSLGFGLDSQDKGPGKAISYSVKYALLKAMGLETGDDPDLDQKTEHIEEARTAPDGSVVPDLFQALVECSNEIEIIIASVESGDYSAGADAWHSLTGGQKSALWVAPSKNDHAPFTTHVRDVLKSKEFREAGAYFNVQESNNV